MVDPGKSKSTGLNCNSNTLLAIIDNRIHDQTKGITVRPVLKDKCIPLCFRHQCWAGMKKDEVPVLGFSKESFR